MIKKAIKTLKNKGIVIYPTDTAYALGCVFDSKKGINRILKIKKRKDQKFTLIASSLYQVEKYFKLNVLQKKLAKENWPGAFSIVVNEKFAVRVPKNKTARALARGAGKPLVATSVNISGQKAIYDLKKIKIDRTKIDFILDAGELKYNRPSRVVKVEDKKIEIIRK